MARVVVHNLTKTFAKDITPVRSVNLEIEDREFLTVLGPSGCGKSTILRLIAGLETPTKGEIFIDDRLVTRVAPSERDIAMVFQNYALYPHMTVYDNIAVNLRLRRVAESEVRQRVADTAKLLEIESLLDRKPKALSGGQRQRVALGRAIIRKPKVFLLDEPLSNLDAILRERMRAELKALFGSLAATVIYVTHDQTEAMTLSSRIAVVSEGRIQQLGTPEEVYHKPASVFVATFLGSPRINIIKCRVEADGVTFGGHNIGINESSRRAVSQRREVLLGIRPEDVQVGEGDVSGRLQLVEPLGAFTLLRIDVGGQVLQALVEPGLFDKENLNVNLTLKSDGLHFFDLETETRL